MTNKNMYVTPLNEEWHKKTCSYWYTVDANAYSHVAFNLRSSLLKWLSERNLTIDEQALAPHRHGGPSVLVTGEYCDQAHMSYDDFYNLPAVVLETRVWSNGQITLARITEDEHGIRTVHTLNPNCHHRPIYDYRETDEWKAQSIGA